MIKNLIKYLVVGLIFSVPGTAQNTGDVLLAKLQTRFDNINDLSAQFVQYTNGKKFLSGTVIYKKKNKLKIETDRLLIVTDGITSWNFNKKENKVIISSYDEDDPSVFSINEIIYEYPKECEISSEVINGEEVLVLVPKTYTFNFNSIKIWLNDDSLISKIVVDDSSMGNTEVNFSNYTLNQNLQDSEFSFTPPEGSKVIDIR